MRTEGRRRVGRGEEEGDRLTTREKREVDREKERGEKTFKRATFPLPLSIYKLDWSSLGQSILTTVGSGGLWSSHAIVQSRQAAQEGLLPGPEDPAAGHGRMAAPLQAALHGE